MANSAYQPLQPAKRPGGSPDQAPSFRVLVHRRYFDQYKRLAEAIGLRQAQELWDHLAMTPYQKPTVGSSCILRGKAGLPRDVGWSRTNHYEASSKARVDYQYNKEYKNTADGDPHPVVAILTISLTSH